MLPKIMKWASATALLMAVAFQGFSQGYGLLLSVVVFMGAAVVLQQAIRERLYLWAAAFAVIALVFNPATPIVQVADDWLQTTALICIAIFAVSLTKLTSRPILSIASITDRTPGSESL